METQIEKKIFGTCTENVRPTIKNLIVLVLGHFLPLSKPL